MAEEGDDNLPVRHCGHESPHDAHSWWPDSGGPGSWCEGVPDRAGPVVDEIEAWWRETAQREIAAVVPKAVEYGADDLVEIGREMVACGVRDPGRGDEGYAELGVFFYEVGKMARWRSAIRRGEPVSDDTLHDTGVYVRMAQRIRAVGGWPTGPKAEW